MKNMEPARFDSEDKDCMTVCLIDSVNVSAREMIEVKKSSLKTSGYGKKIPSQNEKKDDRIRRVISWGDREYDIDEFRALLLKKPGTLIEEGRDDT